MSKIGIIGHGFVGRAIASAHDTDQLLINDPKMFDSIEIDVIKTETDWIYVAVPTPMNENGSIDTSILESVFSSLVGYTGLVISKSTALPDFYLRATAQYGIRLIHVPEFLTAANANADYMKPMLIVIGGNVEDCIYYKDTVIQADKTNTAESKFVATDIGTASAMKYYANSFLATKVIFNNQFARWCVDQGVNWDNVANIAKLDSRLGHTHWSVPGPDGQFGYGGYCFPKDVSAIISSDKNGNVTLLKHQFEVNYNLHNG